MVLGDFLARMGSGRKDDNSAQSDESAVSGPPTPDSLRAALDSTAALVTESHVPSPVTARVLRVIDAVRDTLPRLDSLGAGSATAYNVMATATDYLPDAVNGYLRLPRRFADTRPVDGGRTSLMVLVDQLDLLGATMDRVFDAVYRDDAHALVAHGQFLEDKFGRGSTGGDLSLRPGETAVPAQPTLVGEAATSAPGSQVDGSASPTGGPTPPADDDQPERLPHPEPSSPFDLPGAQAEEPPDAGHPAEVDAAGETDTSDEAEQPPPPTPLRPPSSLDL